MVTQLDDDDVVFGVARPQVPEHLHGLGQIAGDEAQHALIVALHDGHGHQVDLVAGQRGEHIGQAARLVLKENRHLFGCFHGTYLPSYRHILLNPPQVPLEGPAIGSLTPCLAVSFYKTASSLGPAKPMRARRCFPCGHAPYIEQSLWPG